MKPSWTLFAVFVLLVCVQLSFAKKPAEDDDEDDPETILAKKREKEKKLRKVNYSIVTCSS